jgi:UDP-N-acetyl-2-amino-2-deoxyglucuronate dehydrogenase
VSVCSPNYLHDAHIRLALRAGADVICEKPLVINPWNLEALEEIEAETGRRVNTVLQLRLHPQLMALKARLDGEPSSKRHEVELTYITTRGSWYDMSWKGSDERSGGIATNIGIHLFDLVLWLFGSVHESVVHLQDSRRKAGLLELERASVRWFLSAEASDLPFPPEPGKRTTHRSITVDGEEVEFSDGFSDLHVRVYEEALAGRGFGIADARPSITLSAQIRRTPATPGTGRRHPHLKKDG